MPEPIEVTEQQRKAFDWLKKQGENVISEYRDNQGFHVKNNAKIKTKSGIKNVNNALDDAGFVDGMEIDGYRVQRKEFNDGSGFVFKFFAQNAPVDAPDDIFG